MAWRVAKALETLLWQINDAFPNRSQLSDGSLGDSLHRGTVSDHNPDAGGVVRARDFTDDPSHGFYDRAFAERLRINRDPRIKYVISEGQMFSSYAAGAYKAWTWRPYSGENPHTKHVHVSVVATSAADITTPWAGVTAGPPGRATPDYSEDDDVTKDEVVAALIEAVDPARTPSFLLFLKQAIRAETKQALVESFDPKGTPSVRAFVVDLVREELRQIPPSVGGGGSMYIGPTADEVADKVLARIRGVWATPA